MLQRHVALSSVILVVSVMLVACAPSPQVTATPTPAVTPSPTLTPSATPTATPVPPLGLNLLWPDSVSALSPVSLEIELLPPPGVPVTATVTAAILDPDGLPFAGYELTSVDGRRYAAPDLLRFPLEPLEGEWRLVVDVESNLEVEGAHELAFQPDLIPFRTLDRLPESVTLRVPQAFTEIDAQGGDEAGGYRWRYEGKGLDLWWAPGPSEPLLLNTAIVMLEATYEDEEMPQVLDVVETSWQEQPAFLFNEVWPGAKGGAAEAWVIQGPDYWFYVLRLRAAGDEPIPYLIAQVAETFAFIETP